jgi:F-type H+-transporting ATPase subunit b
LRDSIVHSRFTTRIFPIALLAVLVAGSAFAPSRLTAQASAPAAQQAPAASAPAAASQTANSSAADEKAASKEETSTTDAYRHSPAVSALAKLLHLDVETAARIFEIINFLIVALGLGIPLFRLMPKILRKRRETVQANLESARKVTADANTRLSAIEVKLAGLDQEIAQIRVQVEEEIKQDETRIKATLEEESARIVAAAAQELDVAAAQAKRGLRHYAADLAIDQAARQLVLTPQTDQALIAEFLSDVNKQGATKGGQN